MTHVRIRNFAKDVIEPLAHAKVRGCYARDLINDALRAPAAATHDMADALFRTLVLDEGWGVAEATPLYTAMATMADEQL